MISDAAVIDDRSLLELYARTRDGKAFNELARRYPVWSMARACG